MHNIHYELSDTNPISFEEFGIIYGNLQSKIAEYLKDHTLKIDIVSPILRSGGVVGSMLAVNFKVLHMLPIQFKYSYNPVEISQVITLPDILQEVPNDPTILVCEGNTASGATATHAIKLIREKYPTSRILYATVTQVYELNLITLEHVEESFCGVMTNESFVVSDVEAEAMGLRKGITIFPWENAEAEIEDINAFYSS